MVTAGWGVIDVNNSGQVQTSLRKIKVLLMIFSSFLIEVRPAIVFAIFCLLVDNKAELNSDLVPSCSE